MTKQAKINALETSMNLSYDRLVEAINEAVGKAEQMYKNNVSVLSNNYELARKAYQKAIAA